MEEVHEILSRVYSQGTYTEAAGIIKELETLLDSLEHPVDQIVLKKTRKISQKFGYALYAQIPRLYIKYLKIINRQETELLIDLCNDALQVRDTLTGTEICENLSASVRESLVYLIQKGSLDAEQNKIVQNLLEVKQTANFEEEMGFAIEEIENNSSIGLHIMIDLFSTLPSLKDQFYYFSTQISPFIKSLSTKRSVEIYNLTIKFLDILLPNFKYLVRINEETCEYQLSYLKSFAQYEDVFYTSLDLLKILMKTDRFINENCVKILYKLWNLYPALRTQLHDLILSNFKVINSSNSYDPKRKAAEFLYIIMHDRLVGGDFKGQLESANIETIFEDECYDKAQLQPVELKDLKISAGYPICAEIKPGEKFSFYVEITDPNSILSWGFATEDYDISYTISRMGSFEEVLFQGERVACDTTPVVSALFVASPGLFKFDWNNSFSWFRSKKIRFRICSLVPATSSTESMSQTSISLLNPDEIGDLCYVLPNTDYTEVGFSVNSTEISCFASVLEKMPTESDSISGQVSRVLAGLSGQCKKIGIVEKEVVKRDYDLSLGCFALCRDVDALALFNHDSLQDHCLIAVVDNEGIRSSVVIDGKLFKNGDVKNCKDVDPAVAVARLISLFGPATVVFHGEDIEKLVARVRLLVPGGIWNNSQIVFSEYSMAECASKLHYLLYRYKSSF